MQPYDTGFLCLFCNLSAGLKEAVFEIIFLILIRDLFDDPGRISHGHAVVRDILCDNTAGADHHIVSNILSPMDIPIPYSQPEFLVSGCRGWPAV